MNALHASGVLNNSLSAAKNILDLNLQTTPDLEAYYLTTLQTSSKPSCRELLALETEKHGKE